MLAILLFLALHVNSGRLQQTLEQLSQYGRNPEGGVTRPGFSPADKAARDYVMRLMREAGLVVRVDPAGNIYGRREGLVGMVGREKLPVLLFGSHIDSVAKGGNFDGHVGSMGAIEVARALNENKIQTRHPLEVVIWVAEESHPFGGLFGSSAAAGLHPPGILDHKDAAGRTVAQALRDYGLDPARFGEARRNKGEIAAYLELHIEQGGILDQKQIQIGIVEGIVGIRDWTCTAEGFANHAGTTPMDQRRDALAAASRALLLVRQEVRRNPGRQVGTVGMLRVEPGAPNVIPGRVEFSLELRDLSAEVTQRIGERIFAGFREIEREENVEIACTPRVYHAPALTDMRIREAIAAAAADAGFTTLTLPSGAGHDAQSMAHLAPIGMIFVPSVAGISHSPKELSRWEDIARGAEVLYRTILRLDERF